MSPWLLVVGATLAEVLGTLALRMAATGQRRWYAAVAVGYVVAFVLLTLALEAGLPLGVVYGVWAASGVALTAVASRLLFDEPLTRVMVGGIALIAAGVLLVELGAAH
ncbi:DMT family transporter [Nocardioides aurantiacus]|uniref:DMT family transporter n=1 Tax=Nocardioides aurantiacus TaxID=86796 RepID=UPI00403EFD28